MANPLVYADFQNLDDENRLRLTCAGTRRDLERQGIALREGMALTLYTDDADGEGQPDKLLADGFVQYNEAEKCWVAAIDWNAIRHEKDQERKLATTRSADSGEKRPEGNSLEPILSPRQDCLAASSSLEPPLLQGSHTKRRRNAQQLIDDRIIEGAPSFISAAVGNLTDEKRSPAVIEVLCRMPEEEYQQIRENHIWFFSPHPLVRGWNGRIPPNKSQIIYLPPLLETWCRKDCVIMVAHEVAHSLLGHTELSPNNTLEDETWSKVIQLGFGTEEQVREIRSLLGELNSGESGGYSDEQ